MLDADLEQHLHSLEQQEFNGDNQGPDQNDAPTLLIGT